MSKSAGSTGLYAPFVLAFFVFSAVISAEFLVVHWLIEKNAQRQIEDYHDLAGSIIANINRYESVTNEAIYRDSLGSIEFVTVPGVESLSIHIISDSTEYIEHIQPGTIGTLSGIATDYSNLIIETSVGKTQNGEFIVIESVEYANWINKILEKIADSLIIILIMMIIITIVPGSLLIESRTRRLSMIDSLAPSKEEENNSVLQEGLRSSSTVACFVARPDGEVAFMNTACEELLETEVSNKGVSVNSLTVLPLEIRGTDVSSFRKSSRKRISLQFMSGSKKDCILEIHPFHRKDVVAAVMFLLVTTEKKNPGPVEEKAPAGETIDRVKSKAKTHLLKSLIHDMNNHISGIIGISSIELESLDAAGPFASVLDSAEKLASLCGDLQATLEGGNDRRYGDLSHEISLIAEVLRKILPERVEVRATGSCKAWIRADLELLREFFYGLALNSTAIMNGEGRIRIDVSNNIPVYANSIDAVSPGYKVCVRYSDGFIMPVALRDIFSNRNYSVADVERQYGATIGNGYRALNKLEGSIVFERGSGETVLCLLLDGYEQTENEEDFYSRVIRNPDVPGLSVLVADDVDIVLKSVSDYLEQNGMTVVRVSNGDRAMELLKQESFDAAVLDLNMPGVPTSGIVRYCQTSRPDMAVVITSGFDTPHGVKDLIVAPSTGYLHKPHKPEALVEMIYMLVHRLEKGGRNDS